MVISPTVQKVIETATAKAIATIGDTGVNVVPVSMVRVHSESIWLFDFFMNKTSANIKNEPTVALVAWDKMQGIQIKGNATYITEGSDFEEAVAWVKTQNPDRVVQGLIVIEPTALFDVSPGGAYSDAELKLG